MATPGQTKLFFCGTPRIYSHEETTKLQLRNTCLEFNRNPTYVFARELSFPLFGLEPKERISYMESYNWTKYIENLQYNRVSYV